MFPLIPLIALIAIVSGGVTLAWYSELSKEDQKAADKIAGEYALGIYEKSLNELSKAQADHVAELTRQHFAA
jgi:hypothetical protein